MKDERRPAGAAFTDRRSQRTTFPVPVSFCLSCLKPLQHLRPYRDNCIDILMDSAPEKRSFSLEGSEGER